MFFNLPNYYYEIFYYSLLLLFVIILIRNNRVNSQILTITLLTFLLFFIGLRPISYHFGDMGRYALYFEDMKSYGIIKDNSDPGFYQMMFFLSKFVSAKTFFFLLSLLYILPLYFATKKLFPFLYYYAFLMLVVSFSFFSYGTNGLRNGIATSFFILGIVQEKKWLKYLLLGLSLSFHISMVLPIGAYILTSIYNNYKFYLKIWILSIPVSILTGSLFESIFLALGLNFSNKIEGYFSKKEIFEDQFSSTGFRWDFLIYSAVPIFIGYYFLKFKKFNDRFYQRLYNIYLIANAVWILVIRASFSNRFAYLSWFLMGLVIIYPFLKKQYWKNQFFYIGVLIFLYFNFTFIMNVILPLL